MVKRANRAQREYGLSNLPLTSPISRVPGYSQAKDHHKLDKCPQLVQRARLGNQTRYQISSCCNEALRMATE